MASSSLSPPGRGCPCRRAGERAFSVILIALGSNLSGDFETPEALLRVAVRDLAGPGGVCIRAASRIWLTAPVPVSDQPWYRNAVIRVETDKSPSDLMTALLETEARFGRARSVANAARTLDLDLLDFEGQIIHDTPHLTLPHPRMESRAFVLRPLAEIAPEWTHPVSGRGVADLLAALPQDQEAAPMAGEALL